MRVVDAHGRRVMDQVRVEFWHRSGAGVALVVLTGVFVVLALGVAGPLDGVAGVLVFDESGTADQRWAAVRRGDVEPGAKPGEGFIPRSTVRVTSVKRVVRFTR